MPTAVFASNDMMAIGAIRALAGRALRVPDDVSVVGFDDVAMAECVTPPPTTVHQDHYGIGRTAGELLLDVIRGGGSTENSRVIMDQSLVIRDSVRRLR